MGHGPEAGRPRCVPSVRHTFVAPVFMGKGSLETRRIIGCEVVAPVFMGKEKRGILGCEVVAPMLLVLVCLPKKSGVLNRAQVREKKIH